MKLVSLDAGDHVWSDDRGWAMRPLEAAGLSRDHLGDVHVVSVAPGAVRGNHRHPDTTEWMLVFGARVELASRTEGGPVERREAGGDGPVLVEFGPGVAHAVKGVGPGTAYLLCWADGTPTTERVEPLL